jgi:hypothetical protein
MPSWNVMRREGLRYLIGSKGYCCDIIFNSCWNLYEGREQGQSGGHDEGRGRYRMGWGEVGLDDRENIE